MYPTYISFHTVIVIHYQNGNAVFVEGGEENPILSIAEYRQILNDHSTPDERVRERISFLVRHVRKIAKEELKKVCQK